MRKKLVKTFFSVTIRRGRRAVTWRRGRSALLYSTSVERPRRRAKYVLGGVRLRRYLATVFALRAATASFFRRDARL